MDVGFRFYFDYLVYSGTTNHVLYHIPVIYLIGTSLMVFDGGQTPTGEERGDGRSSALIRHPESRADTPVGHAAGVFVSRFR